MNDKCKTKEFLIIIMREVHNNLILKKVYEENMNAIYIFINDFKISY